QSPVSIDWKTECESKRQKKPDLNHEMKTTRNHVGNRQQNTRQRNSFDKPGLVDKAICSVDPGGREEVKGDQPAQDKDRECGARTGENLREDKCQNAHQNERIT